MYEPFLQDTVNTDRLVCQKLNCITYCRVPQIHMIFFSLSHDMYSVSLLKALQLV